MLKKIFKIVGILLLIIILGIFGIIIYHRHLILAGYYVHDGQYDKAMPHLVKLVKNPDDINARRWRFLMVFPHIEDKKYYKEFCEMVISDCSKLLESKPDKDYEYYKHRKQEADATMHFLMSKSYYDKGDYEKAIDYYMKAQKLGLRYYCHIFEDYKFYLSSWYSTDDNDKNGIEPTPDFGYRDIFQNNEFDKPIAFYTVYIKSNLQSGLAYYYRAMAYSKKGEYEQAIPDYSKMIEQVPASPISYLDRGRAYKNIGKYLEALSDFNKGMELSARGSGFFGGEFPCIPYYIDKASTCEKLGKTNEALDIYKAYLEYKSNTKPPDDIRIAKERIKVLGG